MVKCRKQGKKTSNGFTLLELLVSITILSLIITISYSALRMGTRSWDASIVKIEANTKKRSALALIKNKIEHIYPIVWNVDARQVLAFEGSEDSLRFIAPSPQGRELGEYFEYLFIANRNQSETSLELYFEPHYPGTDEFTVSDSSPYREILSQLNSARFSYFGKPDMNSQEDWYTEWNSESSIYPSAILVNLSSEQENAVNVEITIKIQTDMHQI